MPHAAPSDYVLVPGERLDALTCELLLQEAEDEAIANGLVHILIDGRNLASISNAGLRALLNLTRQLEQNGGQLSLCNLSPSVTALITQCGFDRLMPIVPDFAALPDLAKAA